MAQETLSMTMHLLHFNRPLHTWKEQGELTTAGAGFSSRSSDARKVAQSILSQLSHPLVVDLLAQDYDRLPSAVRVMFNDLCNMGNASGNVRKNIQRLDRLLKGKILRQVHDGQFINERVETRVGVVYKKRRVNEAEAAAQRKYAGLAKRGG